jgi:hypothetical protein
LSAEQKSQSKMRFGFFQVRRVNAFSEPVVDFAKRAARFIAMFLLHEELGESYGRPQFARFRTHFGQALSPLPNGPRPARAYLERPSETN